MFNKSNDKSTDLTRGTQISSSNLPMIKKGNKSTRLRNDLKKPIKLVNYSTNQSIGVDSNILLSPKSKSMWDKEQFNTIVTGRSDADMYDSLSEINVNNTIEYLETKPTIDSSSSRNVVEPLILDIAKSKVSEKVSNNDGGVINLDSNCEKMESGMKLLKNIKKVTINLDDAKDDFKIKLKRIETIKEENEDIARNPQCRFKKQHSNPSVVLDQNSIETIEKGKLQIKFKKFISTSKDTQPKHLSKNLKKRRSVSIRNTDRQGSIKNTFNELRQFNNAKSFLRKTKKVMFNTDKFDTRRTAYAHSNKNLYKQTIGTSRNFSRQTISKGLSVGNITLSSDFSSSDTENRFDTCRSTTRVRNQIAKPIDEWERRLLKLKTRLKFSYDKLLLEADDRVKVLKNELKPEKEIHALMAEKFKEKLKVKRGKNLIESYKNSLKNFVRDYLLNGGEELFTFNNDILFERQVLLQDYYNEFIRRKYIDVIYSTELLSYELACSSEVTLFKNFSREQPAEPLVRLNKMYTIISKPKIFKNDIFANKFLLADNVIYNDETCKNEDSDTSEIIIIRPKQQFDRSDTNSSTKYKKTVNIVNEHKVSRRRSNRQRSRKSLLKEFSILSNPTYLKDRKFLQTKKTLKNPRSLFKTQPSMLLNAKVVYK
jgi:hypothetical protein